MPIFTEATLRAIKRLRAMRWTKSITIRHVHQYDAPNGDFYDDPVVASGSPLDSEIGADYTWRTFQHVVGSPGGEMQTADFIGCTDLDYSGALVFSGAQLVVEGKTLAITSVVPDEKKSEVIFTGKVIN